MELWIVRYDDQDYYCEGAHIIGLFMTEEEARNAVEEAKTWSRYCSAYEYTVEPVEVGKLYKPELER